MPSLASKVTLASSIFITGGIIVGVHYFQFDERQQVNERFKKYVVIKNRGRVQFLKTSLFIRNQDLQFAVSFAAPERN